MDYQLVDQDLDLEADALDVDGLLEEDGAEPCLCEHTAGDHTPDGCRASGCLCPAAWDGFGAEEQDDEERVVGRVVALLKAARARRQKADENRDTSTAEPPPFKWTDAGAEPAGPTIRWRVAP